MRVLDNFSTGRRANLTPFLEDITLIEGDLQSYERVHRAVRGVDHVLHIGALPSVPRSVQDPLTSNAVNITGTLNVLLASRDEGVGRVVYASSSSVYGSNHVLPKVEELQPLPMAPYAVSKLAGEQYCRSFFQVYGLETVALRYFNVFGPRQDPQSQYSAVIPRFLTQMREDRSPVVYGDGGQSRDFTYVDNVVEATLRAATTPEVAGEVFNAACGARYSLNELVRRLNYVLGKKLEPEYAPPRPGDVRDSQASIDKARVLLGYEPSVGFEEGLRRTAMRMESVALAVSAAPA